MLDLRLRLAVVNRLPSCMYYVDTQTSLSLRRGPRHSLLTTSFHSDKCAFKRDKACIYSIGVALAVRYILKFLEISEKASFLFIIGLNRYLSQDSANRRQRNNNAARCSAAANINAVRSNIST